MPRRAAAAEFLLRRRHHQKVAAAAAAPAAAPAAALPLGCSSTLPRYSALRVGLILQKVSKHELQYTSAASPFRRCCTSPSAGEPKHSNLKFRHAGWPSLGSSEGDDTLGDTLGALSGNLREPFGLGASMYSSCRKVRPPFILHRFSSNSAELCRTSQLVCSVLILLWTNPADTHNRYIRTRQRNRGFRLALFMSKMMMMMMFVMKGVRRQGNAGCILALIMSRMIFMIILTHHYQHQNGRAFRPKNGGEHRKCSYDSFQMSARSGERPAPGALFILIDSE